MLKINYKLYLEKYYYENISLIDILKIVRYVQFKGEYKFGFLMKKYNFFTKHVDLTLLPDELKGSFSKTVKQEINRATKDGIIFKIYNLDSQKKIDFYINYYNEFANSKNLHFNISKRNILPFLDNTLVTYSEFNGMILSMHRYLLDTASNTVIFVESSSHFRLIEEDEIINRNFIGRANRFLHYQDMLHFKEKGFTIYDLGGYGIDTEDNSILSINRFKDGFKGKLIQENHFESYPFVVLKLFYKISNLLLGKLR